MKLVSIIMPVYNVEKYVGKAIKSVLQQSWNHFELIIVNDGSTDSSYQICKKFADADTRLHLLTQQNEGLSAARNMGLKIATGDYITFIDSDDFWHPLYLEKMVTFKEHFHANIAVCAYQKIHEDSDAAEVVSDSTCCYSGKQYVRNMFGPKVIGAYAWGKLFERSHFIGRRFPIGKLYEDIFTIPYVMYPVEKVIYIKSPLYYYRQRKGSILAKYTPERADELSALSEIVRYAEQQRDHRLSWYARINEVRSWLEIKYRFKKFNFDFATIQQEYGKTIKQDSIRILLPFLKKNQIKLS